MKRFFCLVLCLFLLSLSAGAAQDDASLEAQMQAFMEQYGLDESNFSVSFFNTATGERYAFNDDMFRPVGRVWTLPLHMYYYQQEALGAFDPPPERPDEVYTVGGKTLEECRYQSIFLGNDAVSQELCGEIGTLEQYQLLINSNFGHYPDDSLPDAYRTSLCYSAGFLMNCLLEISGRPEVFGGMMQNFRLAQSGGGIAAYSYPYDLIHLSGREDGFLCEVGEVAAPQTYLLVCLVREEVGGDELLGELNELLCGYVLQGAQEGSDDVPPPSYTRDDAALHITGAADNSRTALPVWIAVAFGAAAAVALVVALILRHKRRKS